MAEEPQQQSHPDREQVSRQQFVNRRDESSEYAERRKGLDSMPVPAPRPVEASAATSSPPDGGSSGQTGGNPDTGAGAQPANGAPVDYDG